MTSPARRRQKDRSAATIARLLDATVSTLVDKGYAGTSTTEICKRAGVSRGAQLHHFPTKGQLVAAAVEHLVRQRLEEFRAHFTGQGASLDTIFDALWETYSGPTLIAWIELLVAARTDEPLRSSLLDVNERLILVAERLVAAFLGQPAIPPKRLSASVRMAFATLDGLALAQMLRPDEDSAKRVLANLRRVVDGWIEEHAQSAGNRT